MVGGVIPPVKKILIIRHGGLGDHVIFSRALKKLRSLEPDAHITFMHSFHMQDFYKNNPYVNQRLDAPVVARLIDENGLDIPALDRALEGLDGQAFDYVYVPDPHETNLYGVIVARIKAKRKIGFRQDRWVIRNYNSNDYFTDLLDRPNLANIADYQEIFFKQVYGVDFKTDGYDLFADPEERRQIERALSGMPRGRGFVAVHGAGTHVMKVLDDAQVSGVIRGVAARGFTPILIGQRPYPALRGSCIDLTKAITIGQQTCLIEACAAIVTVDSGPKHLAAAVETPICEVGHIPDYLARNYGSLLPESRFCGLPAFAPVNGCPHRVVVPTLPGFDERAVETGQAIRSIDPAEILAGFDRLMAESGGHRKSSDEGV